MPKKQMKKKSQKKAKKSSNKKASKPNSTAKNPAKKKLKKSIARKAIRKAVAKRVKKKPAKKKAAGKATAKKKPKKPSKKKIMKKAAKSKVAKKKLSKKKPTGKAAAKPKKLAKPKIKEKKKALPPTPEKELNRAEIRKLLSDSYARHLIIESGGEHALEIVRGFSNNSSDEEMSKKLKIKISDVRATLNKLHSLGIVDYTRHKDSETGWFSYFWCLNVDRMKCWVNERIEEERRNFDFSGGEYYFCPNCGGSSIHEFVSASEFGFKCPTCSSSLDFLSDDKAEELFPMKAFRKPHL